MYPVGQKNQDTRLLSITLPIASQFSKSCTNKFTSKFAIKLLLNTSLHLKDVATLPVPCEDYGKV